MNTVQGRSHLPGGNAFGFRSIGRKFESLLVYFHLLPNWTCVLINSDMGRT